MRALAACWAFVTVKKGEAWVPLLESLPVVDTYRLADATVVRKLRNKRAMGRCVNHKCFDVNNTSQAAKGGKRVC